MARTEQHEQHQQQQRKQGTDETARTASITVTQASHKQDKEARRKQKLHEAEQLWGVMKMALRTQRGDNKATTTSAQSATAGTWEAARTLAKAGARAAASGEGRQLAQATAGA